MSASANKNFLLAVVFSKMHQMHCCLKYRSVILKAFQQTDSVFRDMLLLFHILYRCKNDTNLKWLGVYSFWFLVFLDFDLKASHIGFTVSSFQPCCKAKSAPSH